MSCLKSLGIFTSQSLPLVDILEAGMSQGSDRDPRSLRVYLPPTSGRSCRPRRVPWGVRTASICRFGKPAVFDSLYSLRTHTGMLAFKYVWVFLWMAILTSQATRRRAGDGTPYLKKTPPTEVGGVCFQNEFEPFRELVSNVELLSLISVHGV